VSHSQIANHCGYQLKFHRERAPRGPRGIQLVYGIAVHAGIEHEVRHHHGPDAAFDVALRTLREQVQQLTRPSGRGLRWEDRPRLTKKGEPFKADTGRLGDLASCERMAEIHVRAWIARFGEVEIRSVEETIRIQLRRPEGWEIECRLDMIAAGDLILDVKTASEEWDRKLIEAKAPQAHLYMAAFRQRYEKPPAGFEFHVLPKGSAEVQVVEVAYSPAAINRVLEHLVRPNIAAIEAGVYVPRTDGWWCGPRFCDFWQTCPLGAVAHGDESC
jgi:hypothetical protein